MKSILITLLIVINCLNLLIPANAKPLSNDENDNAKEQETDQHEESNNNNVMNKRVKQAKIGNIESTEEILKKEKPKNDGSIHKAELNKIEKIKKLSDLKKEYRYQSGKKRDEPEKELKHRNWEHHIHIHIHGHHCRNGDFRPPEHPGNFGHFVNSEDKDDNNHYNGQYQPNVHEHHGHSVPLESYHRPDPFHGHQEHHSVEDWDDVRMKERGNSIIKERLEDSQQGKSDKNKVNQAKPINITV